MSDSEAFFIVNPDIVLREEFDEWALLFDPDTGHAFSINPIAVFIWKRLDGETAVEAIARGIEQEFEETPDTALTDVREFVQDMLNQGLVGERVVGQQDLAVF